MRDLLPDLLSWQAAAKPAALATVIKTWGSSPRPAGSHMAVSADGHFCGSVSGGCVESAVIAESQQVIQSGQAKILAYGVADETAWGVGLACGGQIEIFVQPVDWASFSPLLDLIQANQSAWYSFKLAPHARLHLHPAPPENITLPSLSEDSFFDVVLPARQLVVVGAVNLAQPLVRLAKEVGYQTFVVDPRRSFATPERFPTADALIPAWPQEAFAQVDLNPATAVAVLSHDDKIDLPALQLALSSPAFYVGALGSRKTQSRRQQALQEMGVSAASLARIKGPIGLDLGGTSPEEIALAILAEITAEFNRK